MTLKKVEIVFNQVDKPSHQTYIIGESAYDILNSIDSLYYSIITTLSKEEIYDLLDIKILDTNYIQNNIYVYVTSDLNKIKLINDNFIEDISNYPYIRIIPVKSIKTYLNYQHINIDKILYNFKEFKNINKIKEQINLKDLSKYNDISILSKHPISAIKYIRYNLKYNYSNSYNINTKDLFTHIKGLANKEELRYELTNILLNEMPSIYIDALVNSDYIKYIIPEIKKCINIDQNIYHKYDVYNHLIKSCDYAKEYNLIIKLSALLHDIGKPRSKQTKKIDNENTKNIFYNHENIGANMTNRILKRLNFNDKIVNQITKLVKLHMFHYTEEWTMKAVNKFIKTAGQELENLFTLRIADRLGSGIYKTKESSLIKKLKDKIRHANLLSKELKIKDLDINGNQIKELLNIEEGPFLGKILKDIHQQVKKKELDNTYQDIKKYIKGTY